MLVPESEFVSRSGILLPLPLPLPVLLPLPLPNPMVVLAAGPIP